MPVPGLCYTERRNGSLADHREEIAFWALTGKAVNQCLTCAERLMTGTLFVPDKLSGIQSKTQVRTFAQFVTALGEHFFEFDAHLFIMASGIVVRAIAPHLKDKTADPAVMVADEAGQHVISLTSGHLGGGNAWAVKIAAAIGAEPVITTATDVNGILALDALAQRIGAVVENKHMIKKLSTCMLNEVPTALVCDRDLYDACYGRQHIRPDHYDAVDDFDLAKYSALCVISEKMVDLDEELLQKTLLIRPKSLVLGIGCNKGTSREEIAEAVKGVCHDHHLSLLSISKVATVAQKKDEPGLVAYAGSIGGKLISFSAETLNQVDAEGMSPPSAYAEKHIGAKGVAEPAALQCAGAGALLLVSKQKIGNVTVAIAKKASGYTAKKKGRLFVVGIGPGEDAYMTAHARQMLTNSDIIAGYHKYIEHIEGLIDNKEVVSTGMTRETERVDAAIQAAVEGKTVSLVCSGDAGIYGLAGLVYERMHRKGADVAVAISPGITAAAAAASLVGAPLTNDFITLSLSNLLTPTETV